MNIKRVSIDFSVSSQLSVADLGAAAELGFKTVINNRPDHEGPDQPESADLAAHAESLGVAYLHIPVAGGKITDEHIDEFAQAYKNGQRPILGFCASGTRSIALWALTEAAALGVNEVLAASRNAGYELGQLRPRLVERSAR